MERAIGSPAARGRPVRSATRGERRSSACVSVSARLRFGCAEMWGEIPSRYSAAFSASPPGWGQGERVRVGVEGRGRVEGEGWG